jgi:hypothetical protein
MGEGESGRLGLGERGKPHGKGESSELAESNYQLQGLRLDGRKSPLRIVHAFTQQEINVQMTLWGRFKNIPALFLFYPRSLSSKSEVKILLLLQYVRYICTYMHCTCVCTIGPIGM